MIQSILVLAAVTLSTIAGDWCIKIATLRPDGLRSLWFWVGALLYGAPALGWFVLMKSHDLATVAVLYSAATLVMLALLGVAVFREGFGLRETIGIALALASVVVMSSR